MANYEQVLEDFRQQWNLPSTYNLNRMAESVQALRFADSFLKGSSSDNSPATQYKKWFSRTLSIYFSANTTPNENGKYMSSFDAQAFYDSFKNLVQAKYDADAEERGEEPLQVEDVTNGQKQSLENIIANCKRNYKKTLPALWYENLKNGTMDMQNLQNITSNSFDVVDKKWYVEANEMAGELTNILAAREAVKQLRESRPRGFLGAIWWLFNFRINARERDCLEALNTCITTWEAQQFNTEKVLGELMDKTALGRPVNATEKASQPQLQETEQIQNQPSENTELNNVPKAPQMDPVAKQLDETLKKVDSYAMGQELHEKLPANSQMEILRTMGFQTLWKTASKNISQINADFDSAVANGADPQAEMDHVVRKLFVDAFKAVKAWGDYSKMEDKIEATKIMAQTMLERHTALALHSDKLGDAVNGYVEQYTNTMKELSKQDKDFVSEMEEYEFNRMNGVSNNNKERVFDNDNNPFVENDGKIASQVSQAPKQNVPTLNNGNK